MTEESVYSGDRGSDYPLLLRQLEELIAGEPNWVAVLANASALLFQALPGLNWAGFYLAETADGGLVLGPFQGRPACTRIPAGRGVCGAAAASVRTQIVADVHAFPGHIACDSRSVSEIVVPIVSGGRLFGVLDLDSTVPGRFDDTDARFLEAFAALIAARVAGAATAASAGGMEE